MCLYFRFRLNELPSTLERRSEAFSPGSNSNGGGANGDSSRLDELLEEEEEDDDDDIPLPPIGKELIGGGGEGDGVQVLKNHLSQLYQMSETQKKGWNS